MTDGVLSTCQGSKTPSPEAHHGPSEGATPLRPEVRDPHQRNRSSSRKMSSGDGQFDHLGQDHDHIAQGTIVRVVRRQTDCRRTQGRLSLRLGHGGHIEWCGGGRESAPHIVARSNPGLASQSGAPIVEKQGQLHKIRALNGVMGNHCATPVCPIARGGLGESED